MLNNNEIVARIFELFGNIPQAEIAETLNVSEALVSRWKNDALKNGRAPSLKIMCKIVRMKNVTWDWLLTGEGERHRIESRRAPPDDQLAPPQSFESESVESGPDVTELVTAQIKLNTAMNDILLKFLQNKITDQQYAEILMATLQVLRRTAKELDVKIETFRQSERKQRVR